MAEAVVMPQLGYEMVEGTIVSWLVAEGDEVKTGQVIAEVETDKAIVEVEAESDGAVLSIVCPEGTTLLIGEPMAYVGTPGEQPPAGKSPVSVDRRSVVRERHAEAPVEAGIRAGFPPRLPDANGRIELGAMGEAIARRTQTTVQTAAQFYMTIQIDMTDAIEYRRQLNKSLAGDERVSLNDLIVKACALTLKKYPAFNSTFEGDHLQVQDRIAIGMAVALPDGLLVPAVLDADKLSLPEIAKASKDVIERSKRGKLGQDEYYGTFSVSNLGMYNIDWFQSIVVAPQVAVLAIPSIRPTPVVVKKEVAVRQMLAATITADHRAVGGAEATQFLNELQRLLQEPKLLG